MEANLTNSKVAAAHRKLDKIVENVYEKHVANDPGEVFWDSLMKAEDRLNRQLNQRPISSMEIDSYVSSFTKWFTGLCMRVR
jgi:hypothetical protein